MRKMSGKLKIKLIKSMIGRPEKHKKVLRGMGLSKINSTVNLPDLPSIRGMARKISHLVEMEEVKSEA
jgi:large subunit ribosomal protein L30